MAERDGHLPEKLRITLLECRGYMEGEMDKLCLGMLLVYTPGMCISLLC